MRHLPSRERLAGFHPQHQRASGPLPADRCSRRGGLLRVSQSGNCRTVQSAESFYRVRELPPEGFSESGFSESSGFGVFHGMPSMSQPRQLARPRRSPDEVAKMRTHPQVASHLPEAKEPLMKFDTSSRTNGCPTLSALFAGGRVDSFQPLRAGPRLNQRFPESLLTTHDLRPTTKGES